MKIRCYDNRGKERWMSTGQTIPAGWYSGDATLLEVDHIVKINIVQGNPYDQYNEKKYYLTIEPVKS